MLRLRLKKPRWFKGLLLSLLFTGACGVSQELYSARTTDLDRCQTELTRSQGDLTTARARSDEEAGAREHAQTVEMEYLKLRQNLKATETQLDELRRARAQAEQRSDLYRSLVSRLKEMIDAKTLAVEIRKGKMLVKLGDAVLFDPGKADLKPTGESALRTVAAALREIPDRDFVIAGHTDNLPIKSSPYRSNWELSTARAVTVVRFLQQEGVNPSHLAAAGYSEFDRLVDNDTPEHRAQNRRIEIVVMPKLEELPKFEVPPPDAGIENESEPAPIPPPAPSALVAPPTADGGVTVPDAGAPTPSAAPAPAPATTKAPPPKAPAPPTH